MPPPTNGTFLTAGLLTMMPLFMKLGFWIVFKVVRSKSNWWKKQYDFYANYYGEK